jgi:molybdopterin converting factor small subunit
MPCIVNRSRNRRRRWSKHGFDLRQRAYYNERMSVRVEFYGLARQRAGIEQLAIALPEGRATLADVLALVGEAAPQLAASDVWSASGLHPALAANLDGQRFIRDGQTPICDGQSLLILSADAGG